MTQTSDDRTEVCETFEVDGQWVETCMWCSVGPDGAPVCEGEADLPGEPHDDAPSHPVPTGVWVAYPVIDSLPDGTPCIGESGEWAADPEDADAIRTARSLEFFRRYEALTASGQVLDACPGAPPHDHPDRPPITPSTIRDAAAAELPGFAPHVAPGYAITGKRSYLETNGELTFGPATLTLDFDILTIDIDLRASSTFTVDWGDSTPTRTYHDPGGPWPHGAISHVYTHRGIYDITTTQTWAVQFRFPGTDPADPDGGWQAIDDPITVTETIADFDVREVQPVRRR